MSDNRGFEEEVRVLGLAFQNLIIEAIENEVKRLEALGVEREAAQEQVMIRYVKVTEETALDIEKQI